jgi:hypothetical protein
MYVYIIELSVRFRVELPSTNQRSRACKFSVEKINNFRFILLFEVLHAINAELKRRHHWGGLSLRIR